jgi:hypothetical protein
MASALDTASRTDLPKALHRVYLSSMGGSPSNLGEGPSRHCCLIPPRAQTFGGRSLPPSLKKKKPRGQKSFNIILTCGLASGGCSNSRCCSASTDSPGACRSGCVWTACCGRGRATCRWSWTRARESLGSLGILICPGVDAPSVRTAGLSHGRRGPRRSRSPSPRPLGRRSAMAVEGAVGYMSVEVSVGYMSVGWACGRARGEGVG